MTIIDIFSGFLGAGKTTLIRKLIKEGYKGEKLVLIENDFGEIAIDGGFLKDAGVEITEMSSGCICCSLVGDFREALKKVITDYAPDRIIIEPSGVGKLSDVATAVEQVEDVKIGAKVTVVDAGKCRMYMRNFGEFFNNQVENADIIVMSRTDTAKEDAILKASELLRGLNPNVSLISTPWDKLSGEQIIALMRGNDLGSQVEKLEHEHKHHHEHGEHCTCGCHDHDHEHHHHEHDEHCDCGCHDHEHHHHADEVFSSFGVETAKKFTEQEIHSILEAFDESDEFGVILRAKGIIAAEDGKWLHFDYVPGEPNVRYGSAAVIGRLCVIGAGINKEKIKELIGV